MIVSWLMLRLMLKQYFNINEFEIEYNLYGKPELSGRKDVYFNISHCRTGCLCAVADQPIGVDIQEIQPFSWAVTERACCPEELDALRSADNREAEFIRMWVRKESILKMNGLGIAAGLREINTLKYLDAVHVIEKDDTFIAVSCRDESRHGIDDVWFCQDSVAV